MRSDWWKFNESMTSGTRPPVRNIRRGEEGVRASDLGPSENQAKTCHVRSVNLAQVGEENAHTESLSFRDENDFLKLVVSSRPVISMNFPGNSLFSRFPKNLPNCS